MLSLTADNAAANDTMTMHLETLVPSFSGAPTCTRCFLHIINLVAKSILKQFDSMNANVNDDLPVEDRDSDDTSSLDGLTSAGQYDGDEEDVDDDVEGWVDEVETMDADERADLMQSLHPVKVMLVKVSATHIVNQATH
jgi:hypothetical protein